MSKTTAFLSWRQMSEAISHMPEERRDDPVQILIPDPEDENPVALHLGFLVDTIGNLFPAEEKTTTRGVLDNEHHPEHYVLMVDSNPFSPDGDTSYLLTDDGLVGNNTGKTIPM